MDLHKDFGKLNVLRGVDFEIYEGEIIALIGPSGSGKSTLLRCINGIEEATRGAVQIDGVDVTHRSANLDALRASVGFVFQGFNLFPHMSVRRNITLAPTVVKGLPAEQADAIAADLLNKVGLSDKIDAFPNMLSGGQRQRVAIAADLLKKVGLSDKIDAFPNMLSGGQRQRVAIARALAMNPKYMLFDEPTSALDPEMIGEVLEVIRDLAKSGMTMAIVTHEMNFAREIATKIVFMDEGLIVEEAPPKEFFAAPKNPRARDFIAKIL